MHHGIHRRILHGIRRRIRRALSCGFVARLVLACAPYACAPYIGADTGAPDSTEIFRDIVGLLGLP